MNIVVKTELEVHFVLNYEQAKALDAMAGYGADAFLEVFKSKLGKHYITPYENGIRSLFAEIRENGKPIQKAIFEAEKCMNAIKKINDNGALERKQEKK